MRACATANAVFLGLAFAALSFAACSSGQTTPTPPPSGASTETPAAPSSGPSASAAADRAPSAGPSSAAADKTKPSGPPQSDITNEPDGGVVLNNAMTSGDAGASDRVQPLIDLFKANRDSFRACFDLWGKTHKGQSGSEYLVVALKTDGTLQSATINATKSTLHVPEVETCMIDAAKKLTYPKSPSGKETTFTYPFDFRAK